MKALVCGSRDYADQDRLFEEMDLVHAEYDITTVIEGEAKGADTMARIWANHHGIYVEKYPADWKKYGRAAGPIRNKQMLDEGKPDLVVAFPKDGDLEATKGTKNMVTQARARGIKTIVITD